MISRDHDTDQDADEAERDDSINDGEPLGVIEPGPHTASEMA